MRNAAFIVRLFWSVLGHCQSIQPGFATGGRGQGLLRRFKVRIHAVDSTVLEIVANCLDWAKHRRRKAAAKMHLRPDLQSFLPTCAIVDTVAHHDNRRAREVCAGLQAGEIVIFDEAHVDFEHTQELDARGVQWVSHAKDNILFSPKRLWSKGKAGIIKDQLIVLTEKPHGLTLRRVEAWVEVEGKERVMVFLTNNLEWSRSVCDLDSCRWDIEVFFKQVKQTLKLSNFLGHSANAVRWQVYMALLIYVLLRFVAFLSQWSYSFTRLFTVAHSALWERIDLHDHLKNHGTALGRFILLGAPTQAWLPGFSPNPWVIIGVLPLPHAPFSQQMDLSD
jgi:hypothetical protein